jgi:thymidylate kinase
MVTLKAPLENTLIVLIGFAGTGKYTIGRLLSERMGAKLIDNQLINNPIFTVVNADGVTPLPAAVWDKVREIRRVVYEAAREIAPPGLSFIFTLELRESDPAAHRAFLDLEELAAARKSFLVPIRLLCDVEELCRRVSDPARVERLKEISPDRARKKWAEHTVLHPKHENVRTVDVTAKSPGQSVDAIVHEIELIITR